jgi:hypothetical protein
MLGNVGFDEDVRALAGSAADWRMARGSAAAGHGAFADHPLARAWIADGCPKRRGASYVRFFEELDAWSEYWDIYHPETRGRYYFGDGAAEPGWLRAFLPSPGGPPPPAFTSWKRHAVFQRDPSGAELLQRFVEEARRPAVAEAVLAVDDLVRGLVLAHFADAGGGGLDGDAYLDAMARFGADRLPENPERYRRLPDDDGRKGSSLHHTIEGDIMWFGWAVHLEAAQLNAPPGDTGRGLRALLLAGVALGCAMDYSSRGRRRTRSEYQAGDAAAEALLWTRAQTWRLDFDAAAAEVRELYRIREYGDDAA